MKSDQFGKKNDDKNATEDPLATLAKESLRSNENTEPVNEESYEFEVGEQIEDTEEQPPLRSKTPLRGVKREELETEIKEPIRPEAERPAASSTPLRGAKREEPKKEIPTVVSKPAVNERSARTTKKKKKTILPMVILLAVIVLLIGGGIIFYQSGISAVDENSKDPVIIKVENSSGALSVLNQLESKGLVRNKLCAKVYIKLSSPDMIKANTYSFTKGMGLSEMYSAMETGDPNYLSQAKITVKEGQTISQIAEDIAEQVDISKDEILDFWSSEEYLNQLIEKYWFITDDILNKDLLYPLEGYLYPETYFVSTEEKPTVEEITELFLDKMDEELTPLKDDIKTKLDMSVHEFLSFSSVVEAESLFDVDRPKIAGVFVNRMEDGMPLQSDITVLYALQVKKRVKISIAETKTESPYNTYMNKGVPVGPVCSPQIKTMNACLNYEKSDYLFFFATKDGKVIYTKTLKEHGKARKANEWY